MRLYERIKKLARSCTLVGAGLMVISVLLSHLNIILFLILFSLGCIILTAGLVNLRRPEAY